MQLQKQEHYINLQLDPLCDLLTSSPIQMGWEICIEPDPNRRFGCVDNPDRQFGNGSVLTRTRTRSDVPEPLQTLVPTCVPVVGTSTNQVDNAYRLLNPSCRGDIQLCHRLNRWPTDTILTQDIDASARIPYELTLPSRLLKLINSDCSRLVPTLLFHQLCHAKVEIILLTADRKVLRCILARYR